MPERLGRREWLASVFGAAAAARFSAACSEAKPRAFPGSLLGPDVGAGHRLRDELPSLLARAATAPRRRTRVVIVGAGPSGLSAARGLAQRGITDFEVLELEPRPGGTSLSGASVVTPYPWGAHYLPLPRAENAELVALLGEMGVVSIDATGRPFGREPYLVREPEERLFLHGAFRAGLYPRDGASRSDLEELRRFDAIVASLVARRDGRGRRAFTLPLDHSSDDEDLRALDRVSADAWLNVHGLRSERLRWLVEYGCRDDYGTTLHSTSAWAMLLYHVARIDRPGDEPAPYLTWPEGNGALVRHLAKSAEGRLRTGALVVDVSPTETGVEVLTYAPRDGSVAIVEAERAIVSVPHFVARRIVRPLRESSPRDSHASAFTYAPWVVANLHLSQRPSSRGFPPAWDSVFYGSRSLGYVTATHQRGREVGPTVLTYYLPLVDDDPARARQALFDAPLEEWQRAILADLRAAHPDIDEVVTRLDVFRWGHAMVRPVPGFVFGDARAGARAPIGAIHFAHTDLSGVALFEEAFAHGLRAAEEVATASRGGPVEVAR